MKTTLDMHIKVAWWLRPYLYWVGLVYRVTGRQPDLVRVGRMCMRAVKLTVGK